jgi:plasmid stabilization system protein ParE
MGLKAIRIYYVVDDDIIRIILILHGRRDVKPILETEPDD